MKPALRRYGKHAERRPRLAHQHRTATMPPSGRDRWSLTHVRKREEAKVVGNTAARRLFDEGVVVKRVLRRDDRIREAVSSYLSRLCRRKLAARLVYAIASHIAGDARPGVRDPRCHRTDG